jgi:hypothetical protein
MLFTDLKPEGTRVRDDYVVKLDQPGPYVLVVIPYEINAGGFKFDHPAVAARKVKVFEYKHDNGRGRKWWTQKAGIQFYFVVSKRLIDLDESGCWYSYPKVTIGGERATLSCSGYGGSGLWVDLLHDCYVGVNSPLSFLKHVAAIATPPDEATHNGFTQAMYCYDARDLARWQGEAVKAGGGTRFAAGNTVHVREGLTWGGGLTGPFRFESRKGRTYLARSESGSLVRVSYDHVDWFQTAQANGWTIPVPPADFNRVGPLELSVAE